MKNKISFNDFLKTLQKKQNRDENFNKIDDLKVL